MNVHHVGEDAGVVHMTLSMMINDTFVVGEEGDIETIVMTMTVTHYIVVTTDGGIIDIDFLLDPEIGMRNEETEIVMGVGLIDLSLDQFLLLLLIEKETEILVGLNVMKVFIVEMMMFYLLQSQLYLFLV